MTMPLLLVEAEIQKNPAQLSMPCWVEVRVTNLQAEAVLVNKRLGIGYRDSLDRELFAEVFRRGGPEVISKEALLYQRESASARDYIWLEPGNTISTSFDLFDWYGMPGSGEYDLVVSYQADHALGGVPEGILKGLHSSGRAPLSVMA